MTAAKHRPIKDLPRCAVIRSNTMTVNSTHNTYSRFLVALVCLTAVSLARMPGAHAAVGPFVKNGVKEIFRLVGHTGGKQGGVELSRYLGRQGVEEIVERALREGGEEAASRKIIACGPVTRIERTARGKSAARLEYHQQATTADGRYCPAVWSAGHSGGVDSSGGGRLPGEPVRRECPETFKAAGYQSNDRVCPARDGH
ncbi:MAG: hypothetical protein BWY09_02602 [Candidatus Hydrogenedentes bacterium ADurb.Bin179]|nr:MAG: hypothetical protein BWY09_02602 [Candidatus Hydrogenedentes bacterium ADurb.Bin179]